MSILEELHKPDILDCISHLSSDEVFTPPKLVNEILDMLPQELFRSSKTKFLDPCCKSGVFLREIAKRLIEGIKDEIPDLDKRVEHIFKNQLYGLAITELTSLISRRSLYCSKTANGEYSICPFSDYKGNIEYMHINHVWKLGRCEVCGASREKFDKRDVENHAYSFIHANETHYKELWKRLKEMKFDVIIGNPPYQLGVGNEGGNSSKAKAIYHKFVSQAIKLNPRYITMIIPSRWMTRSTEGIPDEWVDEMLNCNKLEVLHDYLNASDCFPGVEIKGGVCYFLYNKGYKGVCNYYLHNTNSEIFEHKGYLNERNIGVVIRDINALSILDKIDLVDNGYASDDIKNFSGLVSPKDFYTNKETLTSSWHGYSKNKNDKYSIKYYLNKNIHKIDYAWVKANDISKNIKTKDLNRVYIPAAGGSGTDSQVLGIPFYGEPNSVCSQTYLVIGYNPDLHHFTKEQCENIISYIKTRFFRYLVSIKKKTQNGPRGVYQFVPLQDFNEEWTDEKLYKKYGLTQEEIDFIESMIRPME